MSKKNGYQSNLILFGYKSSGKTYFGKIVSQALGRVFVDTDQLIEELYKKTFHELLTCRQISLKIGEDGFRQLETKVINSLQKMSNAIISLGGGALLNSDNSAILGNIGKLVYLEVDKEIIKQRIFAAGIPSFFDPLNPEKSFEKMWLERKSVYEKVSTLKINIQGKTDKEVLDELTIIAEL